MEGGYPLSFYNPFLLPLVLSFLLFENIKDPERWVEWREGVGFSVSFRPFVVLLAYLCWLF
jgi:hypothetical protein